MKKLLCVFAVFALMLTGCGSTSQSSGGSSSEQTPETKTDTIELNDLLNDIAGAVPGTAGCSLKQAKAAGEMLDWTENGDAASTSVDDVESWLNNENTLSAADTAYAYAAVLDFADRIVAGDDVSGELSDAGYTLAHDSYSKNKYYAAAKLLSPLFTNLLSEPTTAYTEEASSDYSAVTLDNLSGIWVNSSNGEEYGEMLVISGDKCRVVIPYLTKYGDKPYGIRVRDRSSSGLCPALEVDLKMDGSFEAPLAYYVSGADDTHFWCNTQSERFDKIELD